MNFDGEKSGVNNLIEAAAASRILTFDRVVQRDGRVLVLPKIVAEGQEETTSISEADRQYLAGALTTMPYLLAVHATFNMENRPDLTNLNSRVIPMVGVEAPPRTGKTVILLTAKVKNPELFEVFDWDTFSPQSYREMAARFNEGFDKVLDKNSGLEVFRMAKEVVEKTVSQQEARQSESLGEKLDRAVEEYFKLGELMPKMRAFLVDLPGIDKNRPTDEFDWIRENMPTVRLRREVEDGDLMDEENFWGEGWYLEMYRQLKEGLGQNYRPSPEDRVEGLLPIEWAAVFQQVALRWANKKPENRE